MKIQRVQRYFILNIAIFMMCQKRTYQLNNDIDQDTLSYQSTKHGSDKLKMNQSDEPGFNFTEEEMAKFKIWPKGIIPYFIDDFSFDYSTRQRLRLILSNFNSLIGLSFTELPVLPDNDKERIVFFINRRAVLSCQDYTTNNFTNTGVQRVLLGYDCLGEGSGALAATVLVLVGVPPQHNSPDRDQYIDVNMANIIPEKHQLFQKLKDDEWLFHDVDYDFLSAGHYSFHKYTSNGAATIRPKVDVDVTVPIGEGYGISKKDIWKIKMLYNFISLGRTKPNVKDCSQVYKAGNKLPYLKPSRKELVIPRNKPKKYLGLLKSSNEENDRMEKPEGIEDEAEQHGAKQLKDRAERIEDIDEINYGNNTSQIESEDEDTDQFKDRKDTNGKQSKLAVYLDKDTDYDNSRNHRIRNIVLL